MDFAISLRSLLEEGVVRVDVSFDTWEHYARVAIHIYLREIPRPLSVGRGSWLRVCMCTRVCL